MKFLYIKSGKGYFTNDGKEEHANTIDQISKNDILVLLSKLLDSTETFEMDEYNEEMLKNAAHRIIYKNIYESFLSVLQKRVTFQDEKNNMYRAAIEKYSAELEEQ